MYVRRREVTAPISKESSGGRRVVSPSEYPAATNRLIRWMYDGWRGEIGSWLRVNLACVRGGRARAPGGGRRTPDRFPAGIYATIFYPGEGGFAKTSQTAPRIPSAVSQPAFRCAFGTRLECPRDINATGNTGESFNQFAPMTLGIWPRSPYRAQPPETLRPLRNGLRSRANEKMAH